MTDSDEIERLHQRVNEFELSLEAQKQEWVKAYDIGVTCKHELAKLRKVQESPNFSLGEPVAWIDPKFVKGKAYGMYSPVTTYERPDWTPLYTSAPTIPEGYVLVPVEPTPEMEAAREKAIYDGNSEWDYTLAGVHEPTKDAA